ncbi:MAG: HAMP domain-containing histidine kinase [Ruminococcus sp.]|nr:HAMP domain-containing histidine kinase [Ruminococcus sp.]
MTYVMSIWLVSEIIMFSLLTLFVHLYINQSAELDIRSSLSRQVTSLSENIVNRNGNLRVDESKIEKQYPDMYIVIVDSEGNAIWGSAPEGVDISPERSLAPEKVTAGKASYYYIDRYIRSPMPANSFVRAYVNETDVLSKYIPLRIKYYGGAAVIFAVLTLAMLYALKRFRHSIKTMEASVAKIGTSQSLEHHMDETGHYQEISSLIQAHNRMLDRMQDSFEQQEQFSSDVAHELKTPIAVIKAQCQYALLHMELSDEVRDSFATILKQTQNMQELVTTLLMLSRLESGSNTEMQEQIDLHEIVSAVCEAEQDKPESPEIRFDITDSGNAETLGNIGLVTIAVTNLISNAVKYSEENGMIEVELGTQESTVFVKVTDHGIGMTAEEQQKVFTRFYRADASRSTGGHGLGMPLARKIAQKHGGTVTVESETGKGSCFTLYLAKK